MAKEAIRETIKKTHKLQIEGAVDISTDGKIYIIIDDDIENKQLLADLAINFNGVKAKIAFSQDSEEDVEPVEIEDSEDDDE